MKSHNVTPLAIMLSFKEIGKELADQEFEFVGIDESVMLFLWPVLMEEAANLGGDLLDLYKRKELPDTVLASLYQDTLDKFVAAGVPCLSSVAPPFPIFLIDLMRDEWAGYVRSARHQFVARPVKESEIRTSVLVDIVAAKKKEQR